MSTPTIEALALEYSKAKFTFLGSFVAIEALKNHPKCHETIVDTTKKTSFRFLSTLKLAKKLSSFDMAFSFRKNFYSFLLLYFTKTPIRVGRYTWFSKIFLTKHICFIKEEHLVLNYFRFVKDFISKNIKAKQLKLYIKKKRFKKPTLGISPGATYGLAKCWYPNKFAQVAKYFSQSYDIAIFGSSNEVDIVNSIIKELKHLKVQNYINFVNKTSITELCSYIGGCDIFLTNDSGPMHIAAAMQVPTVAIFGPTKISETSQWKNKNIIVSLNMDCSPCMKRICPLKHHKCMKDIDSAMVINAIKKIV